MKNLKKPKSARYRRSLLESVSSGSDNITKTENSIKRLTLDIINELPNYNYEILKNKPEECERSILEMYLSNDDFEKIFKMTKEEWIPIPDFRKEFLRKQVQLW